MEFTEEIRDRFMKVSPASIGHHIAGGFMKAEIKPVSDERWWGQPIRCA